MANTPERKPFVITRSKWLRGEGANGQLLRPRDGKQCCLGQFASKVAGIDDAVLEALVDFEDLESMDQCNPAVRAFLQYPDDDDDHCRLRNTQLAKHLMETNDDMSLTAEQREAAIANGFSEAGYVVTFED